MYIASQKLQRPCQIAPAITSTWYTRAWSFQEGGAFKSEAQNHFSSVSADLPPGMACEVAEQVHSLPKWAYASCGHVIVGAIPACILTTPCGMPAPTGIQMQ